MSRYLSISNASFIEDLCAGTYDLEVLDGRGCNYTETFIIEEPEEIVVFEVNNTLRENLDCFIKIRPDEIRDKQLKKNILELDVLVKGEESSPQRILLKLQRDTLLTSEDFWIYRSPIPKVEVQQLLALKMQ